METVYYGHLGTKSSYTYTLCFVHNDNTSCGVAMYKQCSFQSVYNY